jgi:mannose-6-phosphate isomerase-like protein (cupin superfamily)
MSSYLIGNAIEDGKNHRGWFVGNFIENQIAHTTDVEIKWDEPKKGTKRDDWSINTTAHTLTVVIFGMQRVTFQDKSFDLGPGDYFLSQPGVPHKYEILEDSLTMSVRWPSLPNDHINR